MKDLIESFPAQMLEAVEIGERASLKNLPSSIENVLICGLGGSGIGGDLVSELLRDELKVPVLVSKGYHLPGFVSEKTLLILCSYSGNTEETVSCTQQAIEKKLKAVCITSGGKLEKLAAANNFDLIKIPSGRPPRASLGYSGVQLFYVLKAAKLIDGSFAQKLKAAAAFLKKEQADIKTEAKAITEKLVGKVVITYAEDRYASTALRFKQQINENSKATCWFNVFPEMNHNEIVGWRKSQECITAIMFRTSDEFDRNHHRMDFIKEHFAGIGQETFDIQAKGSNSLEQHFYLIHMGDWISLYLAEAEGVDATEVNVIDKLKTHLETISA